MAFADSLSLFFLFGQFYLQIFANICSKQLQEYDEVWVVIIPSGKSHLPNKHIGQEELTQLNKLEMQSTSRVPLGASRMGTPKMPSRMGNVMMIRSNWKCWKDPMKSTWLTKIWSYFWMNQNHQALHPQIPSHLSEKKLLFPQHSALLSLKHLRGGLLLYVINDYVCSTCLRSRMFYSTSILYIYIYIYQWNWLMLVHQFRQTKYP